MKLLLISLKMRFYAYKFKWWFYICSDAQKRIICRHMYATTVDSHNAICPKWLPKIRARIAA